MKKLSCIVVSLLALAALLGVARPPVGALESPLSPVYTPLPIRPTTHLHVLPTPTERPTPWPEPVITAGAPVVLDAPMARLYPAVTPAPIRVLRWTWRAE